MPTTRTTTRSRPATTARAHRTATASGARAAIALLLGAGLAAAGSPAATAGTPGGLPPATAPSRTVAGVPGRTTPPTPGHAAPAPAAAGTRWRAPGAAVGAVARGSYVNPVSTPAALSFPDPSVIHGKDGAWYAYATSDPVRAGGPFPQIPILRSTDLVHWRRVGQVFPGARPSWATPTAGLWASDIRYLDGHYVLYYVVTDTVALPGSADSAIGVATAPTPLGPWTDSGGPLVAPRPGNGSYLGTIDPAGFTDRQGGHWLYWSSFNGGGFVTRLSADGLHTVGVPKQVLIDNRYEGIFVVSHGGWYYAFASSTNCCAGPVTGYTVFAGRSRRPDGPFVDRAGVSLHASRVGGTQVIAPYGNRWIGTGHNAVVTDDAGQDWFVYHAIPRDQPYLQPGISRRPMLVDRLDWIGGWPTVRAGLGASDTPQRAPVTTGLLDDIFAPGPLRDRWAVVSGSWGRRSGLAVGGYAAQLAAGGGTLLSRSLLPAATSTLADVRLAAAGRAAGFAVRYAGPGEQVVVQIDAGRRALVVDVVRAGVHHRSASALPASFSYGTWHVVSAQVRGDRLLAQVSADDLDDPVASVAVGLPRRGPTTTAAARRVALVATGQADVDNVRIAALADPVTVAAPLPRTAGAPLAGYSTEFSGTTIPAGWQWVRRDPAAHVAGGALVWPV